MDTNKKKEAMLEAMAKSLGNISQSCKKANISRATHYDWKESDPDYARAVEDIEESVLDFVESKGLQLVQEGNPTLIIFILKTKGRKRGYIERQELDINHDYADIPQEQIEALIAEKLAAMNAAKEQMD